MAPPVAGYVAWYDATQIGGVSDANPLSSWTDLSGNGNTLTNTGGARPTYYSTTTAKLVNGLPTVWFVGSSSQNLQMAANASVSVTACSMFVVLIGDGTLTAEGVFANRPVSPFSTTNFSYYSVGNQWNGSSYNGPNQTPSTSAFLFSLTQDSSHYNAFINKVPWGGNPSNDHIGSAGTYTLEMGGSTQSGEYLTGAISELVFYPSALGTTDRQSVENYLFNKWLTPPSPPPPQPSFVPQMTASTWFGRSAWRRRLDGFLVPPDAERRLVIAH